MTPEVPDDTLTPTQLASGPDWGPAVESTTRRVQHSVFVDAGHGSPNDSAERDATNRQDATPQHLHAQLDVVSPARASLQRLAAEASIDSATGWRRLFPARQRRSSVDCQTILRGPLDRPVTFVVAQTRGEAGKTVTSFGLGSALAAARGGGVVALDNNEAPGDLADRLERTSAKGTRDLLESADYFLRDPSALAVQLEAMLQHQPTGFLDVLASDPMGGPSLTAEEFGIVHAALSKYFRCLVVDTGNSTRAENWQAAVRIADAIIVPVKLRPDHIVPAARMIQGLRDAGEDVDDRIILVVSCGPDDRHIPPIERHKLFTELSLDRFPLLGVPTDPVLNRGTELRWADLRPATRDAYSRLGAAALLTAQSS